MSGSGVSISVVIPFGKLDGNIVRCVQSALTQETSPDEVIVVANNVVSVADARRVLQASSGDDRLRVVDGSACRNGNQARNLGAATATGAWVALLDSDDWWQPGHLTACLATVAAAPMPLDLVYGSIEVHAARGIEVLQAHHFSDDGSAENYLLSYFPAQTSTYFVRRQLMLDEPWAPTLRRHQDYEWFARVARHHSVGVNAAATVCVEWLSERRHKAHRDCWSVVEPWRVHVRRAFYRRHHRRLIRSAFLSRDPFWINLSFSYVLGSLRR